jgi:hypothetical protein
VRIYGIGKSKSSKLKKERIQHRGRRGHTEENQKLKVERREGIQRIRQTAQTETSARRRMRRKKKKGETAVDPQFHPRVIIAKIEYFASFNFGGASA